MNNVNEKKIMKNENVWKIMKEIIINNNEKWIMKKIMKWRMNNESEEMK